MLTTVQRASKVFGAVGKPTAMLQGLEPGDLEAYAELCSEDGVLVDGFKKAYTEAYAAYCEKNKAADDDNANGEEPVSVPPVPEEVEAGAGDPEPEVAPSLFSDQEATE